MNRKKIYMHQFVHFFGNEAWIPISIGLISAHARSSKEFDDNYVIDDLIFERKHPQEIVDGYDDPYMLAFSVYIWNVRLSLEVARLARQRYPNVIIVFGGPSAPTNAGSAEGFLRENPFVDILTSNEGETTFLELALALERGTDLASVTGLFRMENGVYRASSPRSFTKNMDELASPYLDDTFAHILHKDVKFHAIWETSRGCPFRCGFCYWGDLERSKKAQAGSERLEKEMDWFVQNKIELLYIADSNFGYLERDMNTARGLVRRAKESGYPKKVILTWAKNANEKCFEVAKVLQQENLCFPITMSYQSLNDTALKNIQRSNITLDKSKQLRQKYREHGMATYTDLLIGIPGETYESFRNGIEDTIEYGEHDQIQIYQIRILPNTDMAVPEYIANHKIKTVWCPLQSKHGSLIYDDKTVQEMEEIIIETATMPLQDWKRMLEITWFIQTFFCLKASYFINLFLKTHFGLAVMDFCEFFLQRVRRGTTAEFPNLKREIDRLERFIETYLAASPSVDVSDMDLPKVTWPIEEASFLRLSQNSGDYYREFRTIVDQFLAANSIAVDRKLIDQVFDYQRSRVINLNGPAMTEVQFDYNLPQFFEAAMLLNPIALEERAVRMVVDENYHYDTFQDFAQFHVWYGRQGKHFYYHVSYDLQSTGTEIAATDIHTPMPVIST